MKNWLVWWILDKGRSLEKFSGWLTGFDLDSSDVFTWIDLAWSLDINDHKFNYYIKSMYYNLHVLLFPRQFRQNLELLKTSLNLMWTLVLITRRDSCETRRAVERNEHTDLLVEIENLDDLIDLQVFWSY